MYYLKYFPRGSCQIKTSHCAHEDCGRGPAVMPRGGNACCAGGCRHAEPWVCALHPRLAGGGCLRGQPAPAGAHPQGEGCWAVKPSARQHQRRNAVFFLKREESRTSPKPLKSPKKATAGGASVPRAFLKPKAFDRGFGMYLGASPAVSTAVKGRLPRVRPQSHIGEDRH